MPAFPAAVILDTNVVLDCYVFADARCGGLRQALGAGLPWLATAPMRDELARVLQRGFAPRWTADAAAVLAAFDRLARLVPEPAPSRLACSDRDDQKFIDLALAERASLLTKDRALLKLARRAAALGVAVGPPADWRPGAGLVDRASQNAAP